MDERYLFNMAPVYVCVWFDGPRCLAILIFMLVDVQRELFLLTLVSFPIYSHAYLFSNSPHTIKNVLSRLSLPRRGLTDGVMISLGKSWWCVQGTNA